MLPVCEVVYPWKFTWWTICEFTLEVQFSFCLCAKSFTLKAGLQKKTRIHTIEKPYSWSPCKKLFAVICALKSHLKCTLAQNPSVVLKNVRNRLPSQLICKRHLRVHSLERPRSWSQYTKSFAQEDELLEQSRIHTIEKQHCCAYCSKSFAQSGGLRKHMRAHTISLNPFLIYQRSLFSTLEAQIILNKNSVLASALQLINFQERCYIYFQACFTVD
jgi:uncharacterized Zn-finger protein